MSPPGPLPVYTLTRMGVRPHDDGPEAWGWAADHQRARVPLDKREGVVKRKLS